MPERVLLLTGHLAKPRLERVLKSLGETEFTWEILDIGVKVAALMTEAIIRRRLQQPVPADRVMVPGRCRADLDRLSLDMGVPIVRGPNEVEDLPLFLGRGGFEPDLSRFDMRIFAEIVEAADLPVDAILERARALSAAGADVIDLGCLPDTPFPHLEEAVKALKEAGFAVSVDSAEPDELKRGNRAGADFLLSLTEATIEL